MPITESPELRVYSSLVAAEIRAWMGRLNVRQSQLAARLGVVDQWISARLLGKTAIELNELFWIADALGVGVVDLIPENLRQTSAERRVLEDAVASGPFTHPRRRRTGRPTGPGRDQLRSGASSSKCGVGERVIAVAGANSSPGPLPVGPYRSRPAGQTHPSHHEPEPARGSDSRPRQLTRV